MECISVFPFNLSERYLSRTFFNSVSFMTFSNYNIKNRFFR
ncbi:hypothetical protein LEP1GSC121_2000 [Leptospira borgpetersenii serovar Castellonis str. 200801910]|uniref:Uncharacterized protein n=1 Tax=Leptospira borgpetersenii serovar Ballum TaxID=280505 RepID=A0A0S2IV11_LEPBO|nr:hypothetical protein LBBP_03307 [Leptospira borgpetersenii serovar Ballum]EKQ99737.1 hypothetical protein LEP1GSC121_2000 [Leptospira borgpetersenii serovar Castellonis str. 200801910]